MGNSRWRTVASIAGFVVIILISVYIVSIPEEQVEKLAVYGYPGMFLLALIGNATVILPAPWLLLVFTMGAVLHPIGISLTAGTGATIGELSGYLAGLSGQIVVERVDLYERFTRWMERFGRLTILVLAFIPNPFFDVAGIAAGALRMPIQQFLIWCWIGKTLKMLVLAYAGASVVDWFY